MEGSDMAQRDLRRVQRAASRVEKARAELRAAILQASLSGESIRDIASFAGISSTRAYELLQEARKASAQERSEDEQTPGG